MRDAMAEKSLPLGRLGAAAGAVTGDAGGGADAGGGEADAVGRGARALMAAKSFPLGRDRADEPG